MVLNMLINIALNMWTAMVGDWLAWRRFTHILAKYVAVILYTYELLKNKSVRVQNEICTVGSG